MHVSRCEWSERGAFVRVDYETLYGELQVPLAAEDLERLSYHTRDCIELEIHPDFADQVPRKLRIVLAHESTVGLETGTWCLVCSPIGGVSVLRRHHTGNVLNSAADESGIRAGDLLFIPFKPRGQAGQKSERMRRMLELLNKQ